MKPHTALSVSRRRMIREPALIGGILVVAASTRLTGLDLGWFMQDQVRDGMAALGIMSGREFPLVGPQAALSTLNLVGPFYYYLLALPYALSPNPTVGVAFMAFLNLVAIYLTYRLGTEMFGAPVGLVAAALYAVFPMAIFSSKALWNPGFMPFFTVLFLLTLWRFLRWRQPWGLAVVVFLLGVLLQVHLSGAIFVLLLPAALLLYRPPVRPGPLVIGAIGVFFLYAPYFWSQALSGFPDLPRVFAWMAPTAAQSFWLVAGQSFWAPFLLPEGFVNAPLHGIFPWLFPLVQRTELALFCLGLLVLMAHLIKSKDRRPYVLLALWLALPFMIFPHNKIGVRWYYFDVLYPAQFLTIGLLMQTFVAYVGGVTAGKARRWAVTAVTVLVGVCVIVQAWFVFGFQKEVRRAGVVSLPRHSLLGSLTPGGDSMTTMPMRHKRELASRFQQVFNADFYTLERKAHGAVYQLFREDKGFLFGTVSGQVTPGQADPAAHYVLRRRDSPGASDRGHSLDVGPYTIVTYHPAIDYESWKWSVSPASEWWSMEFDDASWSITTLPARTMPDPAVYQGIPYRQWRGTTVAFRGWLEAPSAARPLWIALNIRHSHFFPHDVTALYLNGHALQPSAIIPYDTVNSRNVEMIVDVTSALRTGPNLLAFEITGMNDEFDLDLYELWVAHHVSRTP